LSDFNELGFSQLFSKNPRTPNFMKIRPLGSELFHVEKRTGGHDEANTCSCFSQFYRRA